MTGLWIFLALACLSGLIWHALLQRFWVASLGATLSTTVLFQVAAWLQLGHVDPMARIAVLVGLVPALLLALLAGLIVNARRRRPPLSDA